MYSGKLQNFILLKVKITVTSYYICFFVDIYMYINKQKCNVFNFRQKDQQSCFQQLYP